MMLALALALIASPSVGFYANPPAVARFKDDPPIQVWLSSDNRFVPGERARVYISAAKDGYVVVLRADVQGRIRVLFPLDPGNDEVVRGDRKFEVESSGSQEAFTADDGDGSGVVMAAWSESPFNFDGVVRDGAWDNAALNAQGSGNGSASEAALVDVVQGMAGENHFAYDVANYTVGSVTAMNDEPQGEVQEGDSEPNDAQENDGRSSDVPSYDGPYYGGPYYGPWYGPVYGGVGLSIGYGWRHGYVGVGPFCDGYYWGAWGCGVYSPVYSPLVYRPYRYRSYGVVRFGGVYRGPYTGYGRGSHAYANGYGRSWGGAQTRVRVPVGGRYLGTTNRGFVRARTGTRVYVPGSRSYAPSSRSYAPGSRSYRDGRSARPSYTPRGDRSRGSAPSARGAPSARSAPSGSARRGGGGWSSPAPRSSGGGGYSRGGGGGGRHEGGGGGRRGDGGGGGGRRGGR